MPVATVSAPAATLEAGHYRGNDAALLGIVLAVVTFWLFAQTALNIGPLMARDVGMPMPLMNVAISLAALFSGMFTVVLGGLGDRFGRVRLVLAGNVLGIAGALLIAFAAGHAATPMILLGRILQGLAAGAIMPSTMALLKVHWQGKARQRAISMWAIGTWGGSGLSALFGGFVASSALGWRGIFVLSALVSLASFLLVRKIPESAPLAGRPGRTDWAGIISLAVGLAALLVVVTQGASIGWSSPLTWLLLALFLIALGVFVNAELKVPDPLVDFSLFHNRIFTGATVSNFLINSTAGALVVSLWVLQGAGGMSAAAAGYLTIGYAACIIVFIRVGEKLLQRFGPRTPMLWGCLIVLAAILLLMATHTLQWQYTMLAALAYSLFGLGLAFYATPSTDAALGSLPDTQAGAGSGIYKMASSLGAAFGVAISAAIFTAVAAAGSNAVGTVLEFSGRQDNLAIREAGMVGLAFTALMALMALVSVTVFIPKQEAE
ncbi:MAG: MFS transporter [Lysobacteraceae bacterium]